MTHDHHPTTDTSQRPGASRQLLASETSEGERARRDDQTVRGLSRDEIRRIVRDILG